MSLSNLELIGEELLVFLITKKFFYLSIILFEMWDIFYSCSIWHLLLFSQGG